MKLAAIVADMNLTTEEKKELDLTKIFLYHLIYSRIPTHN